MSYFATDFARVLVVVTYRVDEDLGPLGRAGVVLGEGELDLVPLVLLQTEGLLQLCVLAAGGEAGLLVVIGGVTLVLRRGVVSDQLHLHLAPVLGVTCTLEGSTSFGEYFTI